MGTLHPSQGLNGPLPGRGSDWPHTIPAPGKKRTREGIERLRREDDGLALKRIARWVPQPDQLKKLLTENPERLYFF